MFETDPHPSGSLKMGYMDVYGIPSKSPFPGGKHSGNPGRLKTYQSNPVACIPPKNTVQLVVSDHV
jgi:hypothetical protein